MSAADAGHHHGPPNAATITAVAMHESSMFTRNANHDGGCSRGLIAANARRCHAGCRASTGEHVRRAGREAMRPLSETLGPRLHGAHPLVAAPLAPHDPTEGGQYAGPKAEERGEHDHAITSNSRISGAISPHPVSTWPVGIGRT
jgi:hypothetical protein